MHRFNRRTVQVWYRFVAGIRILSGLRVPGFARSTIRRRSNSVQFGPTLYSLARRLRIVPTRPARQKLKHTGLDLHDERTFRHIVMRFCNFSALTGNFRSGAPSVRCDVARPVHLTASPALWRNTLLGIHVRALRQQEQNLHGLSQGPDGRQLATASLVRLALPHLCGAINVTNQ
jgi:hypothetical protein